MGHDGGRCCALVFLAVTAFCAAAAAAQEPNTDAYFVSRFFSKIGREAPSSGGSSGAVCSWPGVTCDGEGRVVAFAAAGMDLSGAIPEDTVGKLARLQLLDLSGNRLTALPNDLWELGASLRALNLSGNAIRGALPNNVGNFARLQSLDVSHNAFTGALPPALGSLVGLQVLNASHNQFQGQLPGAVVLWCGSLVAMDLSGNALDGDLPDLSPLGSLAFLNLSGNWLGGSVIGAFQEQLRVIDLSNNRFSGLNFSSGYAGSSLIYLDLSGNELVGEFTIASRFRNLRHVNLAHNQLSNGNLLVSMSEISGLEYVNLSSTRLHGQIPVEYSSRLVELKALDLSRNNISGVVPDLSSLRLRVLDLSVNNHILTGEIPVALVKKLASMERFNFSYNNLTVCASELSPEAFAAAFARSRDDCPIAVDPDNIKKSRGKCKGMKLALAIVLSLFFSVLGLLCLAVACRRRRKRCDALPMVKQVPFKEEPGVSGPFAFQTDSTTWVADVKVATSVPVVIFEKPLLSFTFADLLAATSNFDRGTLLAEGRFGPVYRGFLPGGIHVAVKVLVHRSVMADQDAARELERLGRIKHSNLVPLTGYCLAGDQRIAIYEYMENGNLHNLLYDLPLGVQTTEDWSTDTWEDSSGGVATENITPEGTATWIFRHKIALGAARALAFLHHGCIPQIVHRDVKASSIYFDSTMEPRLSDFGLSLVAGTSTDNDLLHHSPGYAPPEFSGSEDAMATAKSDVYSFGVVLFELVTSKKPLDDEYPDQKEASLVKWARAMVKANLGSSIIDPKIRNTGAERQMEEALRIAYLCTAELPSKRPAMQQIVGLLKDIEPKVAKEQD
ncbi:LOW QUALITY PROTEIN: probable LRR receptor-like serine/threonine-protein kinase At2g24230 [Phragmites australis]|uniref:LOW QUALITY PROTEIN: probable LRR receptor-like serine/threonine-protein kinase At2g24230 n=1 Tax=Phragmites australis TaxID=29695 RepID=UPI002D795727|nr:LOW QUALITY PROTEIN: probable LRR receptor-like serine/threonine-protein kinase At2g24230 [Phragmites australis]